MKPNLLLPVRLLSILFIIPLNLFAQCFTAPYGQKPSTTQTTSNCNGSYQTFASKCFNGEYSKVNVVNGNIYSFKSSKSADYITISDDNESVSYATGNGTVFYANTPGRRRSWRLRTSTLSVFLRALCDFVLIFNHGGTECTKVHGVFITDTVSRSVAA